MSAFKPQQRRITIQGRPFHFVSYEGQPANATRGVPCLPAMWYLMVEGRRCPVFPFDPEVPAEAIDGLLSKWVADNGLVPEETPAQAPSAPQAARRRPTW